MPCLEVQQLKLAVKMVYVSILHVVTVLNVAVICSVVKVSTQDTTLWY